MTTSELTQRALELPVEERRTLFETLWESLEEVTRPVCRFTIGRSSSLTSGSPRRLAIPPSESPGKEVEQEIVYALAARRHT
jgi:hypothetical protein